MPDLRGKVAMVTGATDGIGLATAAALGRMGAEVLVHARNRERGSDALTRLAAASPDGSFRMVTGDLSSLREVRSIAAQVVDETTRLDVLINNAGVVPQRRMTTIDGFELTFAVNHLAHFALTTHLLPMLRDKPGSRVVTVSSDLHFRGRIDFDDLQYEKGWTNFAAYSRSKLANILFAYELARREASHGITSNALHPGVVSTKLLVDGFGAYGADSAEEGARTSVLLASAPELATVTARYFEHGAERRSAELTYRHDLQDELWTASESLTEKC